MERVLKRKELVNLLSEKTGFYKKNIDERKAVNDTKI